MVRLIVFEYAWVVFFTLLIAMAYGYFLKLHKLLLLAALAIFGAAVPFARALPQWVRIVAPLCCLAFSCLFFWRFEESAVKKIRQNRKTAFWRAGMMALSTLGIDSRIARSIFKEEKYDENGARISRRALPEGFARQCRLVCGSHVEIYTPQETNGKVVYLFPGGGFAGRFTDRKMAYTWLYSRALHGAATVVLDYKTTLDGVRCPQPLHEALRVYRHMLGEGVAPENILATGDSAGGNLLLVFFYELLKQGLPLPKAGVTFSAWTDLTATSPSFQENRRMDAVFGGNHVIKLAAERYIKGTGKTLWDTDVSPYFLEDFTGFPPMLMQVGGNEMLLSGTVDVAKKMTDCGVDVTVEVYEGMYHEFQRNVSFNEQAREAWESVGRFCDRVFGAERV